MKATHKMPLLIGGLFMSIFGGWFTLGALGVYHISGILVAPWIAACAGLLFFISGLAMLSQLYQPASSRTKRDKNTTLINPVEGGSALIVTWFATLFVLLLVSMFWGLILTGAKSRGNMPEWMLVGIILLFTVIGIVLLIYAIWLTGSALQFSNLKLQLIDYPPRLGGKLTATLLLPPLQSVLSIDATLKCYVINISAADPVAKVNALRAVIKPHWHESKRILLKRGNLNTRADIEFDLPADLPAANWFVFATNQQAITDQHSDYWCRWVLEIEKEVNGPDLKRSFEIAVHPAQHKANAGAQTDAVGDDMSREQAMALIAKSELTKGTLPQAIAVKLTNLGIPLMTINSTFSDLMTADDCPNEQTVLNYLEEQQRLQARERARQRNRMQRIRQIAAQNRAQKPDSPMDAITELEWEDFIRYGRYIIIVAPIIYFVVTLVFIFT